MKKYILLSLLFFCNASIMMGQEKQLTISGHVFDESNESLPGVSVYLKDRAGVVPAPILTEPSSYLPKKEISLYSLLSVTKRWNISF